jgi:hypothetical protein
MIICCWSYCILGYPMIWDALGYGDYNGVRLSARIILRGPLTRLSRSGHTCSRSSRSY